MDIYLYQNEKEVGPYTEEQLRAMVKSSAISQTEHAWHEGLTEWRPLNEIISFPATGPAFPFPPNQTIRDRHVAFSKSKRKTILGISVAAFCFISICGLIFLKNKGPQTQTVVDSNGQSHTEAKALNGEIYRNLNTNATLTIISPEEAEYRVWSHKYPHAVPRIVTAP